MAPSTTSIEIITVRGGRETVDIDGWSVWGIITKLFLAQAYEIVGGGIDE